MYLQPLYFLIQAIFRRKHKLWNDFGIYKFDNTLYRVPITGAELKKYMEWSASCYNQWVPGDISISFDPEKPGYLYDMFAGVDYEIDLSKPAGQRIVNVMYKEPRYEMMKLTLAVNNYRYSSALKAENLSLASPNRNRQIQFAICLSLISKKKEPSIHPLITTGR